MLKMSPADVPGDWTLAFWAQSLCWGSVLSHELSVFHISAEIHQVPQSTTLLAMNKSSKHFQPQEEKWSLVLNRCWFESLDKQCCLSWNGTVWWGIFLKKGCNPKWFVLFSPQWQLNLLIVLLVLNGVGEFKQWDTDLQGPVQRHRQQSHAPSSQHKAPWALDAYLLADEWADTWTGTLPISSAAVTVDANSMA